MYLAVRLFIVVGTAPRRIGRVRGPGFARIAALLLALGGGRALAQVSVDPAPVYHGSFGMSPSSGTIDRRTGGASLAVHRGHLFPVRGSNGIFPDRERIIIALGESSFGLAAGMLKASHGGAVLTYRASRTDGGGIRSFRIRRVGDREYRVQFSVRGLDLSRLNFENPVCLPMAVVVGDDDGFLGVVVSRSSFRAPRFSIPRSCDAGGTWPWARK